MSRTFAQAAAAARLLAGLFLLHPPSKEAARAAGAVGVLLRRAVRAGTCPAPKTLQLSRTPPAGLGLAAGQTADV